MASQQGGGGARPKTPRQSPETMHQASAPTKEGWLIVHKTYWKGRVKRQKRRYCVLEGQSRLVIYKDDTKTKVKAEYPLLHALDVTITVPNSYVFEISMAGDVLPLVLASRDHADMLDWIDTLIGDIWFINGPARHVNCPSQGKL
ncbi:uncharacterized protein [Littorina saxatilis]|uniref:uncharacterized protein n=1 Tax=Littorina saxatilis TaxID=31220 RepID=UPI0038B49EB1